MENIEGCLLSTWTDSCRHNNDSVAQHVVEYANLMHVYYVAYYYVIHLIVQSWLSWGNMQVCNIDTDCYRLIEFIIIIIMFRHLAAV